LVAVREIDQSSGGIRGTVLVFCSVFQPRTGRSTDMTRSLALVGLLVAGVLSFADEIDLAKIDAQIKPKDRQHWAFQSVKAPPVPSVRGTNRVRNPIDAFVLAKLEARGWSPNPSATPQVLFRRLCFDLTGLPPTFAEQDSFESVPDLDRWIEILLSRPQYGEKWARHWLDVVRYAETNGYERDAAKPQVWRYRDYVIWSFNADKPFDRFILEQLAGDELADATSETMLATGFLRLGPWDDEPADPATDRFDQLDDIISTTSQAFLGLTLGCARCHDHKFEPLTTHDYYRMAATFAPLDRPRNGRTELAVTSTPPGQAPGWFDPPAYILSERSTQPAAMHLMIRGSATRPGPRVSSGVPTVLASRQPEPLPANSQTSRRRLSLAHWIASPANPLTARVIVNRVWQWHFGEGLARTPSDFGVNGERPTHPELLDWLADWFVRHDWSIKALHRLILTSNTWSMSKHDRPEYRSVDPENRLLWRMPYRRLDVEALRDATLAVGGRLNTTMYGPSVRPPIPRAALEGNSDPNTVWKPSSEIDAARRTVYVHTKRALMLPLLEVLDFCDTARSSAQRNVTTVAPQALTWFNGDFFNAQAKHLANRLEREAGTDPKQKIELAYRLLLARGPTAVETSRLIEFLRAGGNVVQLCRVLLNLNEFAYVD
jgi:hypothetical protein